MPKHRPQRFYKVRKLGMNEACHRTILPAHAGPEFNTQLNNLYNNTKNDDDDDYRREFSYIGEVLSSVTNPIEASEQFIIGVQDNLEGTQQ